AGEIKSGHELALHVARIDLVERDAAGGYFRLFEAQRPAPRHAQPLEIGDDSRPVVLAPRRGPAGGAQAAAGHERSTQRRPAVGAQAAEDEKRVTQPPRQALGHYDRELFLPLRE